MWPGDRGARLIWFPTVDAAKANPGNVRSHFKSGTVRVLGIADSQESDLLPGAKTLESQGYKVYANAGYIVTAPAHLARSPPSSTRR